MTKYLNQATEHVDVSSDNRPLARIISFLPASFQARNLIRVVRRKRIFVRKEMYWRN